MSQWIQWEDMSSSEKEMFRKLCENTPIILSRENVNGELSYRKRNGIEIDDRLKFQGMICKPVTIQEAERIYKKIYFNNFFKNNLKKRKSSEMTDLQNKNRIIYNKCMNFIGSSNSRSENNKGQCRQNIRWKGYTVDWKDDCGIIQMEEFAPFILKELDQGFKCYYCGKSLENEKFAFDHYVPLAAGGQNKAENIRLSCTECNSKKNSCDPHDILFELKKIEKDGQQKLDLFFPHLSR